MNLQTLNITETKSLDHDTKLQLLHLWNTEYPEKLVYKDLGEFNRYLETLTNSRHLILIDVTAKVFGWAFSFERENENWFAIILSEKIQGKGLGKQLLEKLKQNKKHLNGWVIDHDRDKKSNGKVYRSPMDFYIKCGFEIMTDQRLELEKLSAVRIHWTSKDFF